MRLERAPADLQITVPPDSGNIVVKDLKDPRDIQLEIRGDNNSPHFQWFYFQLHCTNNVECILHIVNAGKSFNPGWHEEKGVASYPYQTVASYDQSDWFRIPTKYNLQNGTLSMTITPAENVIYFALFAPYPLAKHERLIKSASELPRCKMSCLGKSTEFREISLLTIGEPAAHKKRIWLIARQHPGESMAEWFMEGLIERLLSLDADEDNEIQALLKNAVFYLIPNMNPDGTYHGNLKTNAVGYDLNRCWFEPDVNSTPEVFHTRNAMRKFGVDFFIDVHGDETIPYVFLERSVKRSDNSWIGKTCNEFIDFFKAANRHVQDQYNYEMDILNWPTAHNWVYKLFRCPTFVLEMPFKDDANNPDKEKGWSSKAAMQLGASVLTPLLGILPKLNQKGSAMTDLWKTQGKKSSNDESPPASSLFTFT